MRKRGLGVVRACLVYVLGFLIVVLSCMIGTWSYWSYNTTLPNVLWTFTSGAGWSDRVHTYGDKVFVSADANLVVLDDKSGKTLWTVPNAGLVAAGEPVIIDSYTNGVSMIEALESTDGTRLWSISRSSLSFCFATERYIYTSNEKSDTVIPIDRKMGTIKQGIPTGDRALVSKELFADDRVFFVTRDGKIVAVDDTTATQAWTTFIEGTPISVGENKRFPYDAYALDSFLLLRNDKTLRAFDAQTGRLLWTNSYPPTFDWPVLYHDGILYVSQASFLTIPLGPGTSTGKNHFILYAIDARIGDVLFQRTYDGWGGYPLAVIGDNLIVGGHEYAYALNLLNGDVRWRQSAEGSYYKETVIRNSAGYFVSTHGGDELPDRNLLKAIDLTNGRELWNRFYWNGVPWYKIYSSEHVLITESKDGVITAIRLDKVND